MCLSCKRTTRPKVWSFYENRMTGFPIKFDHNEVQQLKKKFNKISGNRQDIDKFTFQKNMGILGLQSMQGFSDRLFNSFDITNDGKISFQDFLQYMQVLKCGNERNKAKISFKLIDIKNKNNVTMDQFKEFLDDYFRSWTSITNSVITPEIKERTDQLVKKLFRKVRQDTKKNYIDFRYYAQKMYGDKQFMDAFQFITEGVANMFISDRLKEDDSQLLYNVLTKIRKLYSASTGQELFMSNMSELQNTLRPSMRFRESATNPSPKKQSAFDLKQQQYPSKPTSASESKFSFLKPNVTETTADHINEKSYNNNHAHCCKNCHIIEVLENKIEFLTEQLRDLVNETNQIYEKLHQKYINRSNHNQKKETVKNIHAHNSYQFSKGNMIFFGDDNWNLVLNMMIGIQMAVRSVRGYQEMIYEEAADFNLKYYFELVPRRFGGEKYISRICSFTDYAPNTFNHIRKMFNIDNQQYINSIGPNKLMASLMMGQVSTLTALTSQGKSGSFFYYTADGKYMLKTIQYREYKHLRNILKDYYYYIKNNPDSLITKFYGLHKLIEKDDKGQIIGRSYFVIMANVFNTKQRIIQRYDIKGSWYGRQTKEERHNPNITLKDNDFRNKMKGGISIVPEQRQKLVSIIKKDSEFFRAHDIIDYSLLIGIIRREQPFHQEQFQYEQSRNIKLYQSVTSNQVYIFGIIDILTEYSSKKVLQYYFKRTFYGQGISAVPPDDYSERFINFISNQVFKKDAS